MAENPSDLYPHLILGIRLGASKADATTALALATRRLKKIQGSTLGVTDLTSALAQIDGTADTERALFFQWPADPRTIPTRFSMNFRGRAFSSADALIGEFGEGDVETMGDQDRNSLGIAYLSKAFDAVNSWEWDTGIEIARKAIACSRNERIQDEALNVIAAANLMLGKKQLAVAALKKAVDGEWNVGLHQNLAVLTMTDDPRAAIDNLAFIVATSRNAQQRVKAVRVALSAWSEVKSSLGSDEDDGEEELPPALRDALREMAVSHIDLADFRMVARYLADKDESWVETRRFSGSPHANSLEARLLVARATDMAEYCEILGANSGPGSPEWIVDEADSVVRELNTLMFKDDTKPFVHILAMKLADGGMNNASVDRIILKGLMAMELHKGIDEKSEPAEKFIVWIDAATRALPVVDTTDDLRSLASAVLRRGAAVFTRLLIRCRAHEHDQLVDIANTLASSRDRSDAAMIVNWANDTTRILPLCRRLVDEDDVIGMIDEMIRLAGELKTFATRFA